jgi:hypothetical protein
VDSIADSSVTVKPFVGIPKDCGMEELKYGLKYGYNWYPEYNDIKIPTMYER